MRAQEARPAAETEAPTFGQFLQEFRESFGGWSATTWRGASGILRGLEAEFGQLPLGQVTSRLIDGYLTKRRREGLSEATCNRYLAALKTMFKTARIWGYVAQSPAEELTMLKEQSRVPSALTDDELERLLAHCPEPLRCVVTLAADTGMRRSELGRLTWADVDFDAGTLTVRRSKNRDYRVIPMTRRVWSLLEGLRARANGTQYVLSRVNVSRPLARAAQRAGIRHVHLHMLRHTVATRLRDRGVPLDRIMEILGHRSYAIVLRYAKARPQQLVEAMRALDAGKGPQPQAGQLSLGIGGR